ncbi:MAG: helix-turn-helix transcriptional regulator [Lentisphaerae bacterium]|nr:helix-turn-helix transcriptional regulator [Lentisphaerota bacterium]
MKYSMLLSCIIDIVMYINYTNMMIKDNTMTNIDFNLKSPVDVMLSIAQRAKALRLEQNITQQELADKVGIAIGTVKRFEKSGEIQFNHLLRIALVLGRLDEFSDIFAPADIPYSLYELKNDKPRQRARKK